MSTFIPFGYRALIIMALAGSVLTFLVSRSIGGRIQFATAALKVGSYVVLDSSGVLERTRIELPRDLAIRVPMMAANYPKIRIAITAVEGDVISFSASAVSDSDIQVELEAFVQKIVAEHLVTLNRFISGKQGEKDSQERSLAVVTNSLEKLNSRTASSLELVLINLQAEQIRGRLAQLNREISEASASNTQIISLAKPTDNSMRNLVFALGFFLCALAGIMITLLLIFLRGLRLPSIEAAPI